MEAADNKEHFESQWRQAFEGAAITPPPMVWQKIEASLATQKESGYKKKIFFYQVAAAAMAVLAAGLGALMLVNSEAPEQEQLSGRTLVVQDISPIGKTADKPATPGPANAERLADMKATEAGAAGASSGDSFSGNGTTFSESRNALALAANDNEAEAPVFSGFVKGSAATERIEMKFEGITARSGKELESNVKALKVSHLYGVARPVVGAREKIENQPLLASLGVGAGSFDPNYRFRSGSSNLMNTSGAAAYSAVSLAPAGAESTSDRFNQFNGLQTNHSRSYREQYSEGGSFSIGGGVGKRIFRKILLHTGLYYGRSSSSGSTDLVLNDSSSNRKFAVNQAALYDQSVKEIYESGSYSYRGEFTNVNNRYEFLTVPVKLGFVLLDRRTGLVLNSGISTEILLSNSVRPDAEGFETTKTRAGEDSPFRNVYFNGTLGLEVNYKIASQYKLFFEPYYRHAITSFTKNSEGFTSSPRTWGVQAGVRYELR